MGKKGHLTFEKSALKIRKEGGGHLHPTEAYLLLKIFPTPFLLHSVKGAQAFSLTHSYTKKLLKI